MLFFVKAFAAWSLWTFIPIVLLSLMILLGVEIARTVDRRKQR
jgi:hypothetical protein